MLNRISKIIIGLAAFASLAAPIVLSAQAKDFVAPQKLTRPLYYVLDQANVISKSAEDELNARIAQFKKATGGEIAIVTINSLGDYSIEEYAVGLFEEWGIGKKAEDNGVLVLIAPHERQARIEVGYGYEGILTDGRAGEINRNDFAPNFKKGDYDTGIVQGLNSIIKILSSDSLSGDSGSVAEPASRVLFGLVWFFILFASIERGIRNYAKHNDKKTSRLWAGVRGVAVGAIFGLLFWFWAGGIIFAALGLLLGLFFPNKILNKGRFWGGGGFHGGGGFGGGSFGGGGFGGGSSGGGGASGRW